MPVAAAEPVPVGVPVGLASLFIIVDLPTIVLLLVVIVAVDVLRSLTTCGNYSSFVVSLDPREVCAVNL